MLAAGYSDRDVAARLTLSVETIRFHIRGAYRALDVHKRADALEALGIANTHCLACGRPYEITTTEETA